MDPNSYRRRGALRAFGIGLTTLCAIVLVQRHSGVSPSRSEAGEQEGLTTTLMAKTDLDLTETVQEMEKHMKEIDQKMRIMQKRFWLEALEPVWQYRSRFWLGKTTDIEDKDQIIPFFLANFVNATDPTLYKRRIYIDLGIKSFGSSVCWMMQNYPVKFDLVYGFECANDLSNIPAIKDSINQCISGTAAETKGYDTNEVIETFKFYYNYIGVENNPRTKPPTRGISQFMKDVGIVEEDFVVLKMDVEGLEYDLVKHLIDDGTHTLLDEVFVEIHYDHPDMHPWEWYNFPYSRNDAQALLTKARDVGMYIHPWP